MSKPQNTPKPHSSSLPPLESLIEDDTAGFILALENFGLSQQIDGVIETLMDVAREACDTDGRVDVAQFRINGAEVIQQLIAAFRMPNLNSEGISQLLDAFQSMEGGFVVDPAVVERVLEEGRRRELFEARTTREVEPVRRRLRATRPKRL